MVVEPVEELELVEAQQHLARHVQVGDHAQHLVRARVRIRVRLRGRARVRVRFRFRVRVRVRVGAAPS